MKAVVFAAGLALSVLAGPGLANDSSAVLGAGGLVFVKNENIRMVSEDLYLSMDEVRVVYRFENLTDEDQAVLVAFPMPAITGSFHGNVSYPTQDRENIFGFKTTFDGEPVNAVLHQYAFALGVDRTKELLKYNLPLAPHVSETDKALNELPEADKQLLVSLGMVEANDWGASVYYVPIWTLESSYTWEALFPAGQEVTVEHTYKPGIGGASSTVILYDQPEIQANYGLKYCIDDPIKNAVRRNLSNPDDLWSAPFYENWLSYVLTTGANWAGPIGTFRLVVDKGRPENLVSFCGEGVTKTGPTTFEVVHEDFWPWEDINVLFLVRIDTD